MKIFKVVLLNLGLLVFLLVTIEIILSFIFYLRDATRELAPIFNQSAFSGHPWVVDIMEDESRLTHNAYGYFVPADIESSTINVKGGERFSTPAVPIPGKTSRLVYCFGGSTMWGFKVADAFTIPSFLNSSELNNEFKFFNFGVQGATIEEQYRHFNDLFPDRPLPQVAIFYIGANEFSGLWLDRGAAGVGADFSLISRRTKDLSLAVIDKSSTFRFLEYLYRLISQKKSLEFAGHVEQSGSPAEVAHKVLSRIKFIEQTLIDIGVTPIFIFQPFLLTGEEEESRPLFPEEAVFLDMFDKKQKRAVRNAYYEVKRHESDYVYDLSDIFAAPLKSQVYIDVVHLGPEGNKAIATAILKILNERFKPRNR